MSELEKVTAVDTTYDASEIQVLEGLEAVRKRPGMYIGSTSASGLHHLVYEIVDNAIDEALAGYCTEITVTINPGDTITVTDNGRGIPVDIQKQTGRPALEVVYTVLHAGGKFGGGGYKVSGGLHGVGASVVNALSEWLEVQVQKDGRIYEMKFSRGAITQEMKILGDTDQTGTAVTFKPDPEMFDTLVYDYETLHTRMREQAFLNAGLRITITDARPGQEQSDSMCYEGGIREFVTWLNRNKTALHEEVVYLAGAKGDSTAEVALQYNDSYNETLVSFANDIHTPEGGMHETGFKTALTRVLNAYGMKYGMIKEGDKVSGEDVRERDHLCYYCSSSFQSFTGSMAVNSGVEHADAARAEQAVLKELADLCDGPITDEELEDCRRGLLAGMNGLEDTLGGIETWYYMEVLRGGPVQTPDDARRALLAVTREDVRDILKQFTLSVSCLLTREEGNENG